MWPYYPYLADSAFPGNFILFSYSSPLKRSLGKAAWLLDKNGTHQDVTVIFPT